MKFSPSTLCFYPDDIEYPDLPADIVDVPESEFLAAMQRPVGYVLAWKNGHVVAVPPSVLPPSLDEVKAAKLAEITAACEKAITGGFTSRALGDTYTYPSTPTDQLTLSANVLSSLLPNLPADWTTLQICADKAGNWAYRPHTAAQIQQVGADGKAAILACLTKKAQLQAKIEAATDVKTVQAIAWS